MKPIKTLLGSLASISGAIILSTSALAQSSAVYRCAADNVPPTYTNNPQGLKGCEMVSGAAITTLPAFKAPTRSSTAGNAGPADFPKIEADVQKQRDELGRRPILERELRDREERCTAIRKEYNNAAPNRLIGEETPNYQQRTANLKTQTERCDADLLAIRRELSALK